MQQRYLSQLAHVSLLTPKLEESTNFFTNVLGMEEVLRDGSSVYLRAWGDMFHHSLKLTEADQAGLDHAGWRAEGPDELEAVVGRLEAAGIGEGWVDDETGHGAAYRYRGPHGHLHEVFWDVTWHQPADGEASVAPNRPSRFNPHGAYVRRLDHVTLNTADPRADRGFYCDTLGYRYREGTVLDNGLQVAAFVSTSPMSHDLGLVFDQTDIPGRLSHVAFWLDTHDDVIRAADVYRDAGVDIEFGPGKHGIGENFYLYALEPGGNRIELYTGGYFVYAPDWGPVEWTPAQFPNSYWQAEVPGTLGDGTPRLELAIESKA